MVKFILGFIAAVITMAAVSFNSKPARIWNYHGSIVYENKGTRILNCYTGVIRALDEKQANKFYVNHMEHERKALNGKIEKQKIYFGEVTDKNITIIGK